VHVVTVPQERSRDHGDLLWLRMCAAFGIDPAWAPVDSDRYNRSLGVAEVQVIRQLNRRMDRATRRDPVYDGLIRDMLAQRELVNRKSVPVRLPPERYDWAEEQTERWIEWIEGSGVNVIGDLDDLRPVRPAVGTPWRDPDKVSPRRRLSAALAALEAMTREAGQRPDPKRQFSTRVRSHAQRLRER
jgi:hypothetical protein